jgi:hypothetical protein
VILAAGILVPAAQGDGSFLCFGNYDSRNEWWVKRIKQNKKMQNKTKDNLWNSKM